LSNQPPQADPDAQPSAATDGNRVFDCVILAGDREQSDPLRRHSAISCKALIPIQGTPMIHKVIDALRQSDCIDAIHLSGPEARDLESDQTLSQWAKDGAIHWSPPEMSPSTSAYNFLKALPDDKPALITTADLPMLTPEIVEHFCHQAAASDCDLLVGLAPHTIIQTAYPKMRKTVLRFREGGYCGCNLFAFITPKGREVADFWRRIERQRKKPLLVIGLLGWWAILRYKLGLLTLDAALSRLSKKLGLKLGAVILPYPHAAVDVDSVLDYELVQEYTAKER